MIKQVLFGLVGVIAVSYPSFAAEHEINQAGKKFSKKEISVSVGDTVVFKNDDKNFNSFIGGPRNRFLPSCACYTEC